MNLVEIAERLRDEASPLEFSSPVSHVYNPLVYAWAPHRLYLERYGGGQPEVVLVGMNPGPFGMAQTGVPFGDVTMVVEWLGIEAPVGRPAHAHPKRPVEGFQTPRREVSGTRLWGWARERFGTPEAFFARFFVLNYCPLCFIEASARNRTPDKLPAKERAPLFAACDRALVDTVRALGARHVLGVGAFAAGRIAEALDSSVDTGQIPHPSPANPAANRGWARLMDEALVRLRIELP